MTPSKTAALCFAVREETYRSSLTTEGFREEDIWNFDQLGWKNTTTWLREAKDYDTRINGSYRKIVMENNYLDICAQNVPPHNDNVSDYETNLWRTPSSPTIQSIQANNNVKIRISNSKEVKNTITITLLTEVQLLSEEYGDSGAAGRPAAYFVFVVIIMAEFFLEELEYFTVAFLGSVNFFFFCMQFRIARTQYRQFDGECRQNTHPQSA